MSVIFSTVFSNEIKIPAPNIQQLIDSYPTRQRTGVVRLSYYGMEQLYFLFKRGEILNVYHVTPEAWKNLTIEQGLEWVASAGDAYAKSVALSSFGLLMIKLMLQSHKKTESMSVRRSDLLEYLDQFREKNDFTLLQLEWRNATGMVFFERNAEPHFHFISRDTFVEETGSLAALSEWDEPQCSVTLFPPDASADAWQEYFLRKTFTKICEGLISRLEALTGRTLVDSLVRLVVVFASHQRLDISITARKLEDREVFSSPQEAARSYNLLLGETFKHFSAVIGPRLHSGILNEIIRGLPQQEHQALHKFELLPQGYLK